ncbi:MAG: hypothetical protein KA763_12455, partial [Xanthomonadales bacterium]|nr:hypothetical protein [Xanthomonadales bacterium]
MEIILGFFASFEKAQMPFFLRQTPAMGKDVARIAVRDLHWSKIESQPQFCEGDLFWLRDKSAALEVVAIREFLEVHFVLRNHGRTAFHLKAEQLEDWLEHGVPENTRPIAPALSYSDILRFSIHHP